MNRKTYLKILFASFFLTQVSCKKNNLVIDKDPILPPSFSEFVLNGDAATSATVQYFITNDASSEYKIPIGITTVSNVDRKIQLSYTSITGAVQGTQYTAPTSVNIPAGKTLDTLRIKGNFSEYPTGRKDSVKIKITGGDVASNIYKDSVLVVMQKYCDVVLSDLEGDYSKTDEYQSSGAHSYGPYTTTVYSLTSTGPTSAEGFIANIYDDGWNDIKIQLDWSNPASFKVTVPSQPTGKSYSGAATNVRSSTGQINTFSSCDRSFILTLDLINGTTVISSNYKVVFKN